MDRQELRLRVWEQENENMRFQDMKRWNRFKWVFLIEGAMLYFTYIDSHLYKFLLHRSIFASFCSIMILYITFLIVKDGLNAQGHGLRMKDYEKFIQIEGYPGHRLPWPWHIRGYCVTNLGLFVVNLFNILITFDTFRKCYDCSAGVLITLSIYVICIVLYCLLLLPFFSRRE